MNKSKGCENKADRPEQPVQFSASETEGGEPGGINNMCAQDRQKQGRTEKEGRSDKLVVRSRDSLSLIEQENLYSELVLGTRKRSSENGNTK